MHFISLHDHRRIVEEMQTEFGQMLHDLFILQYVVPLPDNKTMTRWECRACGMASLDDWAKIEHTERCDFRNALNRIEQASFGQSRTNADRRRVVSELLGSSEQQRHEWAWQQGNGGGGHIYDITDHSVVAVAPRHLEDTSEYVAAVSWHNADIESRKQ